jgi:hypothetical protein
VFPSPSGDRQDGAHRIHSSWVIAMPFEVNWGRNIETNTWTKCSGICNRAFSHPVGWSALDQETPRDCTAFAFAPQSTMTTYLPKSSSYVDITLFPTGTLIIPDWVLHKDGTKEADAKPVYAFLIEHPTNGKKVFFDLGIHNVCLHKLNWLSGLGHLYAKDEGMVVWFVCTDRSCQKSRRSSFAEKGNCSRWNQSSDFQVGPLTSK